jgi:hypothetical protein
VGVPVGVVTTGVPVGAGASPVVGVLGLAGTGVVVGVGAGVGVAVVTVACPSAVADAGSWVDSEVTCVTGGAAGGGVTGLVGAAGTITGT